MAAREIPKWEDKFIDLLISSGSVSLAARGSGVSRATVYNYRKSSAQFAARWDEALDEGLELLEAEAWSRARKQSDTLLIFLLKANRPDKYQDRFKIAMDVNIVNKTVSAFREAGMSEEEIVAFFERAQELALIRADRNRLGE